MQQWIATNITSWICNSQAIFGVGQIAIYVAVLLIGMTILQFLPDWLAGGVLFSKKMLFITLFVDAAYIFVIFVFPYITLTMAIAFLVVIIFFILAIFAWKKWH